MDQEGDIVKYEESSVIKVQHDLKSSCNVEGNLSSCAENNDAQEFSGKETPVLCSNESNKGDVSEAMTKPNLSEGSASDSDSDDASTIRNESTNENAESFNVLINDNKLEDIDENLGNQSSHDNVRENIGQNEVSSNFISDKSDETPKLTENSNEACENTHKKSEKSKEITGREITIDVSLLSDGDENQDIVEPSTDDENMTLVMEKVEEGNWNEGIQEEISNQLIQDQKEAEIEYCELRLELEKFVKVTCDSHECGDNVVANKSEEVCGTQVPGVEVMGPKTNDDMKNNLPEKEKTAEDETKDSQRPRSRTYPFKVLVSGLPLGARREDMMYYFSQFGEVLKLWDEGRHRANVLFADEESFKKAVFAPDPYFDDHKLLIRGLNENVTIISGIPRSIPARDAEKSVKSTLEEAGVGPCRISVPLSDPSEATAGNVIQGHALVTFCDQQTLQKAAARQNNEPFMVDDSPLKIYSSCNEFYEKFCIRVFPLPADQQRTVLYRNLHAAFNPLGEIIAIICQFVASATAYSSYVLFETEESVQQAKEMGEVKVFEEFVQIQSFHPFEQGQGFRHLWLKVLNLPARATITEIKHHFGHDKGILNIELDLDFGSCFVHVNSEETIQRCLQMHQTYLRGKCIAVLIAEDHPDRAYYREISRRGRRPNYRNSTSRKKTAANNSAAGFNGKTFTSATQPQGNQDRRGFERGDRKFSKSRSNARHPKESPKPVKEDGDGVKIADSPAV